MRKVRANLSRLCNVEFISATAHIPIFVTCLFSSQVVHQTPSSSFVDLFLLKMHRNKMMRHFLTPCMFRSTISIGFYIVFSVWPPYCCVESSERAGTGEEGKVGQLQEGNRSKRKRAKEAQKDGDGQKANERDIRGNHAKVRDWIIFLNFGDVTSCL